MSGWAVVIVVVVLAQGVLQLGTFDRRFAACFPRRPAANTPDLEVSGVVSRLAAELAHKLIISILQLGDVENLPESGPEDRSWETPVLAGFTCAHKAAFHHSVVILGLRGTRFVASANATHTHTHTPMHRILPILDQNLHQNFGEKNWQAKTTSEKGFVLKTIFGPFRAQIEPKCQRGGSFIRGPQLKIISIMDERVDLTPFSIQWIGIQKLFSKPGHYFKSAKTKKC